MKENRILVARLTHLIKGTTSVERLVVIEAIEETGNVLFGTMLPLAVALERRIGGPLRYCGTFHFERESGHTVGVDHSEFMRLSLGPVERARCMALADEVFSLFAAWTHELLRYAVAHPAGAPRCGGSRQAVPGASRGPRASFSFRQCSFDREQRAERFVDRARVGKARFQVLVENAEEPRCSRRL